MPGRRLQRDAEHAAVEVDGAAAGEPAPDADAAGGAGGGVDLPVGPLEAAEDDRRRVRHSSSAGSAGPPRTIASSSASAASGSSEPASIARGGPLTRC